MDIFNISMIIYHTYIEYREYFIIRSWSLNLSKITKCPAFVFYNSDSMKFPNKQDIWLILLKNPIRHCLETALV